jgi:hypothetical protein
MDANSKAESIRFELREFDDDFQVIIQKAWDSRVFTMDFYEELLAGFGRQRKLTTMHLSNDPAMIDKALATTAGLPPT